jgi:hypothetical protein
VDLALLGYYDPLLNDLELHIVKAAKQHDANTLRTASATSCTACSRSS